MMSKLKVLLHDRLNCKLNKDCFDCAAFVFVVAFTNFICVVYEIN